MGFGASRLGGTVPTVNERQIKVVSTYDHSPFSEIRATGHEGFKSSLLDSYNKLGVVVVPFQAPRLDPSICWSGERKRDRKLAVRGASSSGRYGAI